jgi:hypothetical protein
MYLWMMMHLEGEDLIVWSQWISGFGRKFVLKLHWRYRFEIAGSWSACIRFSRKVVDILLFDFPFEMFQDFSVRC